jgi:hypothetical protein
MTQTMKGHTGMFEHKAGCIRGFGIREGAWSTPWPFGNHNNFSQLQNQERDYKGERYAVLSAGNRDSFVLQKKRVRVMFSFPSLATTA